MKDLTHARSAMDSGLVIALVASAGIALAACGGSATTSPSETSSPAAASAAAATLAAAVDPCLVGTWTVVAQNQNSPANDEQIAYSGGTGEIFTIDAQGGVTIDTHAAQKVVFVSAGETFTATVAGTGRGTLTTTGGSTRRFQFQPSSDDTRTTHSLGPDGVELGPPRPDTAFTAVYTCAPGRFTFYKTAVDYMVDGPIVTLTSGSGNASSTTNPTASPTGVIVPSPSAAPTGSAGPKSFTSATYGYSLTLPAGWSMTPASATWDGKSGLSSDSAEVDQFIGPASATSTGVATPYAKKLLDYVLDLIHWTYKYHGDTCPPTPESQTPVKIGGVPGMLLQWNCGILINSAVTVRNGIAYQFLFRDQAVAAATDPADKATFLALLASVRFPK
jgi:hypothetical protein